MGAIYTCYKSEISIIQEPRCQIFMALIFAHLSFEFTWLQIPEVERFAPKRIKILG